MIIRKKYWRSNEQSVSDDLLIIGNQCLFPWYASRECFKIIYIPLSIDIIKLLFLPQDYFTTHEKNEFSYF